VLVCSTRAFLNEMWVSSAHRESWVSSQKATPALK
jgi:hypothetical protein